MLREKVIILAVRRDGCLPDDNGSWSKNSGGVAVRAGR